MLSSQDKQYLYGFGNPVSPGAIHVLHPQVIQPFEMLRHEAGKQGLELCIASGFRSFDRQLSIWNRKVTGELAVLDNDGIPMDISSISSKQLVFAILRWSALPGASRHHWGTDFDIYDAAVLPKDYHLQLTAGEAHHLFGKLHGWLDMRITNNSAMNFFRPYDAERGGVAPELWHLSYVPLAREFQRAFSVEALADILQQSDLELKEVVLDNLGEIYRRFIDVPDAAYPHPLEKPPEESAEQI